MIQPTRDLIASILFCFVLFVFFSRYLIAGKNIKAGEVILREKPVAVGPGVFEDNYFCFACLKLLIKVNKELQYVCKKCCVAPLCGPDCEVTTILNRLVILINNQDLSLLILIIVRLSRERMVITHPKSVRFSRTTKIYQRIKYTIL